MKKELFNPVIISGIAQNAKEGAVIETTDMIYYLEGLHSWDTSVSGKKVEVKGDLIKETPVAGGEELKDKGGKWKQGSIGDKYIIAHPTWKIIE